MRPRPNRTFTEPDHHPEFALKNSIFEAGLTCPLIGSRFVAEPVLREGLVLPCFDRLGAGLDLTGLGGH